MKEGLIAVSRLFVKDEVTAFVGRFVKDERRAV